MSVLVMVYKGQRVDLTCQMKDADAVLDAFKAHNVLFGKKYTSIPNNMPSTITFVGLYTDGPASYLTDLAARLHQMSQKDEIGNVYLKFVKKAENGEKKPLKAKDNPERKHFGPAKEVYNCTYPKEEFLTMPIIGSEDSPEATL